MGPKKQTPKASPHIKFLLTVVGKDSTDIEMSCEVAKEFVGEYSLGLSFIRRTFIDLANGGDALDESSDLDTDLSDIIRATVINLYVKWLSHYSKKKSNNKDFPEPRSPGTWDEYVSFYLEDETVVFTITVIEDES